MDARIMDCIMDVDINGCVTITDLPSDSLPELLFDPKVLRGLTELHMNCTICAHCSSIMLLTALTILDLSYNNEVEAVTQDIGKMVGASS
jgi:hypothetical protein